MSWPGSLAFLVVIAPGAARHDMVRRQHGAGLMLRQAMHPLVDRAEVDVRQTEQLVEEILSLPISADHADAEIDRVVAAVRAFFRA